MGDFGRLRGVRDGWDDVLGSSYKLDAGIHGVIASASEPSCHGAPGLPRRRQHLVESDHRHAVPFVRDVHGHLKRYQLGHDRRNTLS